MRVDPGDGTPTTVSQGQELDSPRGIAVVPEPAGALLGLSALAGLAFVARRHG